VSAFSHFFFSNPRFVPEEKRKNGEKKIMAAKKTSKFSFLFYASDSSSAKANKTY